MQIRNVEKKIYAEKRRVLVQNLFKEGWTVGEISKILKLDRTWVWKIITGR